MPGTRWSSWHLFHHGNDAEVDDFLLNAVAPAARRMVDEGHCSGWFYIRYWVGGPHIRLRLRDTNAERSRELTEELRHWLLERPPTGAPLLAEEYYGALRPGVAESSHEWHAHGDVVEAEYEPEVQRYGGPAAIDLAEDVFIASTQVALSALRERRRDDKADRLLGIAFNLLIAFVEGAAGDDRAAAAALRRYVYSERYNREGAPIDMPRVYEAAEVNFSGRRESYAAQLQRVRLALRQEPDRVSYLKRWYDVVGDYAQSIRALEESRQLQGWATPWTVLLSQQHMMQNRLALGLTEEYHLSWLLSLAIVDAAVGADFHQSGLATPAQRYHENSKYFQSQFGLQAPRPVTDSPARSADLVVQPLVAPEDLGERDSLVGALASRRSALGAYGGDIPAAHLSTILYHSVGQRTEERIGVDGTAARVRTRRHPSAGGWLPTRLLLYPACVSGVAPALYEYLPERGGLGILRSEVDLSELLNTSPYLEDGRAAGVSGRVPLWLFVVGTTPPITRRYGQRAYRFVLLEAGHLTQNVLLVSTALGYQSVTLGAFYDDSLSQFLGLDGIDDLPFYIIPVGRVELKPAHG